MNPIKKSENNEVQQLTMLIGVYMSVKYVTVIANFTSKKHLEEFLYRLKLNFLNSNTTK